MNHKKSSSRQNAAEKMRKRDGLAETPAVPLSSRQVNQGRFPGESALTGEDRPVDRAGDRRDAFDADAPSVQEAAQGHPRIRRVGGGTMPHKKSSSPDAR